MKTLTYTRRENARRAALHAGIRKELIEITVHKSIGEVRFGFTECAKPKLEQVTTFFGNVIDSETRVGVCAAIRVWLDKNPEATLAQLKQSAVKFNWNTTTVTCQYYRWRKSYSVNL